MEPTPAFVTDFEADAVPVTPQSGQDSSGQSGNRAIGQGARVGSSFRSIALWKESQAFAERVAELIVHLPADAASRPIGTQLVRAAGSIPANIAEGYGRFSQPAYRNHLSIARGSAFEAESWIDLLMRRGYLPAEVAAELLAQCSNVQRMLSTRMRQLGGARQTYAREKGDSYEA
jgi:four helix bundle protein